METDIADGDAPETSLGLDEPAPPKDRRGWIFAFASLAVAAAAVIASSRVPKPLPPDLPRLGGDRDLLVEPLPYSPEAIAAAKPLVDPRDFLDSAQAPSARVRIQPANVSGRLPPELVQQNLRRNLGRYRRCYAEGLRRNPSLRGRVRVRFVIGRDGAVSMVQNGGSDLPDGAVVACLVNAARGMAFPAPEGGIVTVVAPIHLSPG